MLHINCKERIKAARECRGMTQQELADASGVSRSSIARYEIGAKTPSIASTYKLAKALDVPFEELARGFIVEV